MDLWAKKTTPECEDVETERLVRPMPKDKPPRRDRRRERVDVDYDPDTDERDPDESQNYKDIGGSVGGLLRRWSKARNVPVRNRDTGKVVPGGVSPETLKGPEGSKYEVIKPDELEVQPGKSEKKKPKDEEKSQKKKPKDEEDKPVLESGEDDAEAEAEAKAKAEAARELASQWTNRGKHKRPEFQRYLESIPTNDLDKATGEVLVLDPKTKKKVPFDKLPPEAQARLIEVYFKQKEQRGLSKAEAKKERQRQVKASQFLSEVGPKVREALEQLADPNSEASRLAAKLVEQGYDLADIRPDKLFPELKDLGVPRGLTSVAQTKDIVEAARAYDVLSEQNKAGVGAPQRREVSELEKDQTASLVAQTFPPEIASNIIAQDMHPDDVRDLINTYQTQKSVSIEDPTAFAKQVSGVYATDPARVKPPKTWEKNGKEVPFEELDPKEQADAYRKHQMQTVALSLAAKEQLSKALELRNWRGKPRVPPEVAAMLSSIMLISDKSAQTTNQMASDVYDTTLKSGTQAPIGNRTVRALLKKLDPQAKTVAQAFFLANDYHAAKSKFLGSEEGISEWSSSKEITKGLQKAADFFAKRSQLYGVEPGTSANLATSVSSQFRHRVLDRLEALMPEKHLQVQARMDKVEAAEYDRDYKKWERSYAKWLARKAKHELEQLDAQPFGGAAPHLKGKIAPEPFSEPEPLEPLKPARYGLHESQGKDGRKAMDKVLERAGVTKNASRVARRFVISTYVGCETMDQSYNRTAVYHGVEPYADPPEPYPGWGQAHQRDLGEDDYEVILAAARDWLETPVLSENVEGIIPDQRFRAALDYAIQTSQYRQAICPEKYNWLLVRLVGAPEPDLGRTIWGSTCGNRLERTGQVRKNVMTTKLSERQSKKASEILGRYDRLAQDIQDNHVAWGMSFEDAKTAVNKLDAAADAFEKATFGEASLQCRQREVLAAVLQRDPDEGYIDSFQNIHQPQQTDGDEPYMGAYGDDQSSSVEQGKKETGEDLVP